MGAADWIVLDYLDRGAARLYRRGPAALSARGPLAGGASHAAAGCHRMASEGTSTVPRMGSFKRSLFGGYRCPEVDAAISARDSRISDLKREVAARGADRAPTRRPRIENRELPPLSGMVIEREREIRTLNQQLREANDRAERSVESLALATERMQEIEAQARGQATRIRMKALREAVEISRRVQEVSQWRPKRPDSRAPGAGCLRGLRPGRDRSPR